MVGRTARSATRTCMMSLDVLVNGSPRGGGSGTPTGIVITLPSQGWEFDKSVLPKGREDCQHWLDGDSRSTIHNVKPTFTPSILAYLHTSV